MDKLHLKKAIVGRAWIPAGMVQGSFWSSNWESLMLSALDSPGKSKTLYMPWIIRNIPEPVQATDEFVTDGASFKQNTLPRRYFVLDDRPYAFLEHIVPDSVLEQMRQP